MMWALATPGRRKVGRNFVASSGPFSAFLRGLFSVCRQPIVTCLWTQRLIGGRDFQSRAALGGLFGRLRSSASLDPFGLLGWSYKAT